MKFTLTYLGLLALACWVQAPAPCRAAPGETAAVVSSEAGPFADAAEAFSEAYGAPVDHYTAASGNLALQDETRYVAAFGAAASLLNYPDRALVVRALAPVRQPGGRHFEISMLPAPEKAVAAYKRLQPGLARLAVFWSVYPGEKYLSDLRAAGRNAGVEIITVRLQSPDSIPGRLRRLMGRIDAFWLMPDPVLITETSIRILSAFSCSNSIPFYAPTHPLLAQGASASFSPDFRASGVAAAAVIRALAAGVTVTRITYPEGTLQVNHSLSEKCRWPLKP